MPPRMGPALNALHSPQQSGKEGDGLVVSEFNDDHARPHADEGLEHAERSLE